METISFLTKDKIKIAGCYLEKEKKLAGLLLHMMPETKESFKDFMNLAGNQGISTLAIDLRGHGESAMGPDKYKNFSDKDHQKSILDVEAGIKFLIDQGFRKENIFLMGASIGANLSLWYQSEHPEIKATILLSPGVDYRGILGKELAKKLKNNQQVFILAGEKDCGYRPNNNCADKMAREIFESILHQNKKLEIFNTSAHGTTLLLKYPELNQEIINWLKEIYK